MSLSLQKKKVTKRVWFNDILWDVVKIISPTKHNHYILIQRKRIDQRVYGTDVNPIDMKLIDCGNNEFYPDTKKVGKLMKEQSKQKCDYGEAKAKLSDIWLDLFHKPEPIKNKNIKKRKKK